MRLQFYREENKWYVSVPTWIGSKDELEMVCGADTMLDILSKGEESVWLELSPEKITDHKAELHLQDIDESGGYYDLWYGDDKMEFDVWLCNVTLFVFGKFPEKIFIK